MCYIKCPNCKEFDLSGICICPTYLEILCDPCNDRIADMEDSEVPE